MFDYPQGTFAARPPGAVEGTGEAIPCAVHPVTGFPRVEVQVDGERYGMLLDTGASYTMVSEAIIARWARRHPDWTVRTGAVGPANMGVEGEERFTMMRVPTMMLGPLPLQQVAVVARPAGTFEKWLSQHMTEPVVGALAGNVLTGLRLEIDYAGGRTFLQPSAEVGPEDLDLVAVTWALRDDGGYVVAGADPCYAGVIMPGDRLLAVDGRSVEGWSLPEVVAALRGRPGEVKNLVLERGGREVLVEAPVIRAL